MRIQSAQHKGMFNGVMKRAVVQAPNFMSYTNIFNVFNEMLH